MLEHKSRLFLDANLLVLLTVGSLKRDLIQKHKKCCTHAFTVADFDLLLQIIAPFGEIALLPNTLTEASNLLRSRGEPDKSFLTDRLGKIIQANSEFYASSRNASAVSHFEALGLTDAALLQILTVSDVLVSTDAVLCIRTQSLGFNAVNFTHARIAAGILDPA